MWVRAAVLAALVGTMLTSCVSLPLCSDVDVAFVTKSSRDVRLDRLGRYVYCPRDSTGHCLEGGVSCVVR
jgi:hypothetical protein